MPQTPRDKKSRQAVFPSLTLGFTWAHENLKIFVSTVVAAMLNRSSHWDIEYL